MALWKRFLHPSAPEIVIETPAEVERNIRLAVVNGVLFIFADTLLDPTLVLVAFVAHLTDSPLLLGLVLPIHDAAWSLPQLWVSGYLQNQPVKIEHYRRMSFVRILAWGLMAVSIGLVHSPVWALAGFFATFTIASVANGFSGLAFLEVVSKTVPPQRRGEVFALRFGLGGLLGIGGSVLVRWLIGSESPLAFPSNFGVLAFAFFVIASISLLIYNTVHEQPDPNPPPRRGLADQLRRARQVLASNRNYRQLVAAQSLLLFANMATPFFAIFVQQELGGSTSWVGIYLGTLLGTNLLANYLFGRLSRSTNNQRVLVGAALAGSLMSLLMTLLALLARPLNISPLAASIWLLPVFVLSGFRFTGTGIATNSLLLNLAPPSDRTLVIGFTQSLMGIVLLATGLGGVLVQVFGFTFLALVTLAAHLAALWAALHLHDVLEPAEAARAE